MIEEEYESVDKMEKLVAQVHGDYGKGGQAGIEVNLALLVDCHHYE